MSNILEYKGYYTKIEYNSADNMLFGKIEGIRDFVNFECDKLSEVEKEFHSAVDDYLAYCKENGYEPDKTYSGKFNVRISPKMHKKLSEKALLNGLSLNQCVEIAISDYISGIKYKRETK